MIKKIINVINENILYITIIICVMAIWMIYVENLKNIEEHLTNNSLTIKPNKPNEVITSEIFNKIFVSQNKKINFRCTIDGINYYLANMPMSSCKTQSIDCYNSAVVLIPETDIQNQLDSYLKTIKLNTGICNYTYKMKCLDNLTNLTNLSNSSNSAKTNNCDELQNKCNIDRFYLHDFKIDDVTGNDNKGNDNIKKYLFRGTSIPNTKENGTIQPTMFNQYLKYDKNISMLCGDTYIYGSVNSPNEYAEVIVSEKIIDNVGIIKNHPEIRIQLLFNTQDVVKGVDPKTGLTKYIPWPGINPNKQYTYVCLCENDSYTCSDGFRSYKRICLLTANEITASNATILEFEPIIVN